MSFESNYLKLRAEREKNSAKPAGDVKSPAGSKKDSFRSSNDSFTSGYLALRNKRESMSIAERAEERVRLLKQQGTSDQTGSILRNSPTSKGYYSPPAFGFGGAGEQLYSNITAMEPVLKEKLSALDTARASLVQSETDLKTVRGYLEQAREAYNADPSEVNATSYNQIAGAYNLAHDSYSAAFKAYSAAYDDYKPYEEEAINALTLYQLYGDNQQELFDHWRGTIRDAETIQNDIATIDQKIVLQEAADKASAEAASKESIAQYEARQKEKPWYEKMLGYLGETQDTSLSTAGVTPGTIQTARDEKWKKPSAEMQSLLDAKKLLEEELDWSRYYYYTDYSTADDFEAMSKYVPQEQTDRRALDIILGNYSDDASGWEDPLYEYINGNEEAGAYLSNAGANYYGSDNPLGSIFGRITESKSESQQMDDPEIAIFNYLYATQGKAAAHAYYNYLQKDLNYRQRKADEKQWKLYASKHPGAASVFSVAVSPLKGLSYLGQLSDIVGTGTIDENAGYNKFSYVPSKIRETVPENWGAVGTFAYQTGMSMADFLLTTAITGGNSTAALTIMGSGAAADTTLAAKDRGLEDWQAFTLGTVAGIAEALTEKVSLDTLLDADLLKDGALRYVLKNAFAEGSEEVASSTLNLMADVIVSKDRSEWWKAIKAYTAKDMDEDQAFARAMADQALSLGVDFLGGFISGGVMGGGGAVIGNVNTKKIGTELGKLQLSDEDIRAFIDTGLESDPDTASYQLAKEMQAKIEAGEELSNNDLARLYQANVQAIQAEKRTAEDLPQDDTEAVDTPITWLPFSSTLDKKYTRAYKALYAGRITKAEFDARWNEIEHQEKLDANSTDEDILSRRMLKRQIDEDWDKTHTQEELEGGPVETSGEITQEFKSVEQALLEADTQNGQFDTTKQQNVTPTQVNDTALPAGVPLSVAEQLRLEEVQNGGTQYESTQRTAAGPAASQPEEGLILRSGASISDGSTERHAGTSTAEQTGVLAGGTRSGSVGRTAFASRAAIDRQARAKNLRLEKVSSLDLGLQNGSETRNIQIVPQEYWDSEMTQLDNRIYNETNKHITFVMGRIQIRSKSGAVSYVRGVFTEERIIVQADHLRIPTEQIADHEAYHAKAAFSKGWLNNEIRRHILETFSEEQYRAVLETYVKQLRCVYNLTEAKTVEEYEEILNIIEEEIFADAYAGINAFSAGADQFTSAVNERMTQLSMGKLKALDNGTKQTTGPPMERYSISEISSDETNYGEGVVLDTNIFNGIKSRDWGKVLSKFVYENLAGTKLTIYDDSGQPEIIQFVNKNERVMKEGAKSPRKAIDELARYRGDNIRAIATVHLSEILQTSKFEETTNEHNHQWLDEYGWELRTAFFADRNGRIYRATLNIAQAKDGRKILYAINKIKHIDNMKKAPVQAQMPSTVSGEARTESHDAFANTVTESKRNVKERFSFAGENANNADLDALARAKEMQAAGVADETIRQQTGWFTGMDGKWRWEIDDSTMRYDSSGDLRGAESAKWAMEDYESARDDLWGHADMDTLEKVRAYNRADIASDDATKQKLYDELVNGPYAYYCNQYIEAMNQAKTAHSAPVGGTLQDYIYHPTLFEAYPQLRNVTLRFERMSGGNMGYFNRTDNEIVLNTELRNAPEDTLVHEIQHVIQKAEGFTRGSNEEYWQQRQDGDDAVHVYDAKIQDTQKQVDEIMHQVPENEAEQFRRWSRLDDSSQEAMMLMQELADGPYGRQFNDYFMATWNLDNMKGHNYKRSARDLYQNTAGEIEARDAAARRYLTPEQRRSQEPVRGDSDTVFMEEVDEQAIAEMDVEYGPQMQVYFDPNISAAEMNDNIQQITQMASVVQITGEEFAKGEKDLVTQVNEFFAQLGNSAHNPQLGDVILDRRGIKDDIAHGIGRKKAAAFAAVPDVIEQGLIVDYQINWKGRGYDTAVVAAPITIGEADHIAAVIVIRSNQTNRFYVHEVLTTENGAMPFKTGTREGYPGGDAPSVLSILDRIRTVKNQNEAADRFSADDVDSHGHSLTQEQQAFFAQSKVRDNSGRLMVLYHQTDGDFTIFDTRHPGAGSRDSDTPFGIFLKQPAGDIGLAGKKQMALYANITNPLRAANREDLARQLREISGSYADISNKHKKLDAEYHEKFEQAKKAWRDYIIEWRAANPGANSRALNDDPKYNELFDAVDAVVDEWTTAADLLSTQAKETITEDLRKAGYDGIFLENDVGSWGRQTNAIIALDPQQVKNTSNKTPTNNPDIRYSVDDEGSPQAQEQKLAEPKKKIRPVAESRPLIAKKDLRSTVINLFSIPNGQRAEVGAMIDSYADRLIKNGSLTENDRKAFFDRMYDAGVMVMPAEEYSAFARSHIVDGRIYVSDSVKSDFGDDWADIRRRAFAAGIYLVNDRSAYGIDQWNATLSAEDMLPGLFDSEETDERTILERIIQVAEEGKDEHLSLAEYTRRLSQQEGISEDEFLDNMERQLDWALRTFAEKARLEVHLRDRTGRKIAQEREKGAERMTRQQAKEAQRRADERQARKDSARRAKERRELRELQQRTLKQLQWLSKNRNRAPEEMKAIWDEVLGDIDLYAISAADEMRWSNKHNATWKDLAQMYKDAMTNDPNFLPSKELERIVTRLDATKIADMDLGALQDLYKAAIGLRTEFYNRNNVINDEMQRLFAEVYTDAKREIESAPGGFTGGVADKFLNLGQLTPMNVLQRMAGWDPDGAFYSMAKQLERGERDMRAYSVKAQKMLQDFLTEHKDWVKKADGQGKDAIWYEVEVPQLLELGMGDKPIFGPTVKVYMTPAQKVHMYLESKNLDNLRHMTGGRTFVNKDLYSQGKRQEALSQGRTIKLAPETVRKLVSDLTPEEMELAQILDRYYNTFATQEINKVSNILYGYDKAMGKNYAPIYTNRNYTKTEFGVFDTTAEGVGNLKGRQYAVNPSYNISAFDAFERHVDQTARFCGMAIPARNWTTLMNWREKNNSTGDVITHKWGEESKRYITDLITTLQAGDDAKSDTISSGLSKLQSNYITATFGANPSIVLKQLGSIPLAGAYLDARNMPTPAQISKIDRSLISKYTQELEWRTMGYATPETKQLKDNPNWTQTNKAFKFVFGGGAITAMDGWAASTLWPWAENKVRREHPELAVGTKAQIDAGESAFYKKVAEEFEIAVSRSQSVSDEIHQGTLRKSKNPITKAFTMFRSDSAQTYNALRQKIGEARYYMRTGAKDKVIQTAKKAVGTAFMAMLLNAAWSEAISFMMALWKNKGKYYRDDEDELTLQSVAGEMVSNMLGSCAGVVTGGEELFELIGNIITGDTWYGIETPGMEQLNDLLDTLIESGSGMRDLVAGGWDVVKNGGNLGDYFSKHSGEMLGGIKDQARAAAMYLSGLPASNLEAYLTGAMKWISPELGAAYDDLFAETGKSDLAGMEGDALEGRIGRILSDRNVSESDDTADALAELYEAGYKTAIPSDTPTSVSIDGEKHSLGEYQQQAYDTIWGGIVADALDDMVATDSFKEADPKTQAKMLSNLYTYAAEQAKAELFDEYELDSGATKNAAIVSAGATVAECITWNTITSEMKSGEKSAELASWDIPEEAKREIFHGKISDSREGSIAAFDEAGLSFDQFLQAHSKYAEINNMELKAGMKAVEFSHWVNAQGYTAEQAAVVKNELTYFNMTPANSGRYDGFVGAGMDPEDAYDLNKELNALQPDEGEVDVSSLRKWRISVDFSDNVEDQLVALSAVMTDAQFQKVEIANDFGITPDTYVTLQEIKPRYDADGNGSYKNTEIQAAIEALPGYYTTEQKAVLWQLTSGSTSSKNNPYSQQVGNQILEAKKTSKKQTALTSDDTDSDSFSQEILKQLLGRG